jgi:hypothetical protein
LPSAPLIRFPFLRMRGIHFLSSLNGQTASPAQSGKSQAGCPPEVLSRAVAAVVEDAKAAASHANTFASGAALALIHFGL